MPYAGGRKASTGGGSAGLHAHARRTCSLAGHSEPVHARPLRPDVTALTVGRTGVLLIAALATGLLGELAAPVG